MSVVSVKHLLWSSPHKRAGKSSSFCSSSVLYLELATSHASHICMLSLENRECYLSLLFIPYEGNIKRNNPLGMLGDLLLFLVHYPSVEEADRKWQARKVRMDMDNIFVIATDRDGFTPEYLPRFNALPYRKKIFTHVPVDSPDCVCIPGEAGDCQVRGLMEPTAAGHRVIDAFDWVGWFNGNGEK